MTAYNSAVEAAKWCREKDAFGDTNFQRCMRWAEAVSMDRGRTAITSSELRAEMHTRNQYTSAVMRWLLMVDYTLTPLISSTYVSDIDGVRDDPNDKTRADFAALFRDFGEKPTSKDHIEARMKWEKQEKEYKC